MIRTVIACLMFICSFALAQTQTAPPSVLPNRPDAAGPGGDQDLLGEKFESMAAGISFRGPAGWKLVHNRGGDEVVQFVDEETHRVLMVNRLDFTPRVPWRQLQVHDDVVGGQGGIEAEVDPAHELFVRTRGAERSAIQHDLPALDAEPHHTRLGERGRQRQQQRRGQDSRHIAFRLTLQSTKSLNQTQC